MKKSSLLLTILCCVLASCSFNKVPPSDIYTISPVVGKSRSTSVTMMDKTSLPVIKLAPIRASRAFNSTDIIYSTTLYDQNSYAYSRWSDAPVKLLPILFQATLEQNGSFRAVIATPSAAAADFLLESTLSDFSHHIHEDGTSEGVISIRFYLIGTREKTVTATREFYSRVPAASHIAADGAAALNQAAGNVAHELATWLGGVKL